MIKIAFICHGNICRSPMAKFIFLKLINDNNLQDHFYVDSFATSDEEIYLGRGNPMYPNAKNELKAHNIPFSENYAKQIRSSDYEKYDYFICMDNSNIYNLLKIFNNDKGNKVKLLLENRSVSDPWYTRDFTKAYNDIYEGCVNLLNKLK